MAQLIHITTTAEVAAPPQVKIDGVPLGTRTLRIQDDNGAPFARIYIDEARQFDCEVWIDGTLRHLVPRESPWARVAYDHMEGGTEVELAPSEPPPAIGHSLRPHLDPILAEMGSHPSAALLRSWHALRAMWMVHSRNASELIHVLDSLANDPLLAMEMVQNVRPPVVREAMTAEIDQRLHNYMASSVSLIEQTRRLADQHVTKQVRDAYDRRRKALTSEGRFVFLRDLRNYALHYSIPFTQHTLSWRATDPDFTFKVELSTSMLSEWNGWKAPAKTFLAEAGSSVDLRAIVTDHVQAYTDLWEWLFAQERPLSRLALVARDEFAAEHDWVLSGGRESRPRRPWAIVPAGELRFPRRT